MEDSFYKDIFNNFKNHIERSDLNSTREITSHIKNFFADYTKKIPGAKYLLGNGSHKEYLIDILITTFNPEDIINKDLSLKVTEFRAILAVESEIGGESASGPYGVMKNAVKDFCKLLVVDSQYKIMIFTSLPFAHEKNDSNYIAKRVAIFQKLIKQGNVSSNPILLIHLRGYKPNTQVQIDLTEKIEGFVISKDFFDLL